MRSGGIRHHIDAAHQGFPDGREGTARQPVLSASDTLHERGPRPHALASLWGSPQPDPSMPFPMDLSRCLALAPERTPLTVTLIFFPALRRHCEARGLSEGDRVIIAGATDEHVLLETCAGTVLPIERRYAFMIEVEPREQYADRAPAPTTGATWARSASSFGFPRQPMEIVDRA